MLALSQKLKLINKQARKRAQLITNANMPQIVMVVVVLVVAKKTLHTKIYNLYSFNYDRTRVQMSLFFDSFNRQSSASADLLIN